jgi:Divergent InlB B-repeat domain
VGSNVRLLRPAMRYAVCAAAGLLVVGVGAGAPSDHSVSTPPKTVPVMVSTVGSGDGVVRLLGSSCVGSCTERVARGTVVDLVALPEPGSLLQRWEGACTGAAAVCTIVVTQPTTVQALLVLSEEAAPRSLTVERVGFGEVTSVPPGIACGHACAAEFPTGNHVRLRAVPERGFRFVGWAGDCTETPCSIGMNANRTVRAEFRRTYGLSVATGAHVTSVPRGIDCGLVCFHRFLAGSLVILVSEADAPAVTSWGGACRGSAPACLLTMDADYTVAASAGTREMRAFTVTVSGEGSVSSSPPGIDCWPSCSAAFVPGTSLNLMARGSAQASFRNWGGACLNGESSCTAAAGGVDFALASFRRKYRLNVNVTGEADADLAVRSSPAGIGCGRDCSASYESGTLVELRSPVPAVWGGACELTGPRCLVRLDADTDVHAELLPPPPVSITFASTIASLQRVQEPEHYGVNVTVSGNGIVVSEPAGIRCGRRERPCRAAFKPGARVTLMARSSRRMPLARWGGDCRGSRRACQVPVPPIYGGASAAFRRK